MSFCGFMACKKPSWVQEELRRRGFISTQLNLGLLCVEKGTKATTAKRILQQQAQDNKLDGIDFVALLKACAIQKDLCKGSKLHADVHEKGLLKKNIFIGNSLVNMYAKCGALLKAQQVFDELPVRTIVSWTALIAGYAQHGRGEDALEYYERMKEEGLFPDGVTLACILKACGGIGAAERGKEIHAEIVKEGLLGKVDLLGSALVDMYAKCGALAKARKVFEDLPLRNVISWTALITGYCQRGYGEEALNCFAQMKEEGFSPDAVTLACILKACGSIGAAEKGKEIHDEIATKGLLKNDTVLGNALVDMYAKCGALEKAHQVFDELLGRNVVSWNALITGYCQHGCGEEALNCFDWMKDERVSPDAVTFACVLKACGSIGAVEKGKEIHSDIVREGLLKKVGRLGSSLVDMYAKCGALSKAREVFYTLSDRDLVSWTALIAGYSEHGHGKEALNCFEQMTGEGISPDAVTFACILKACGSIGAAEKGLMYFEAVSSKYGIVPTLEHHTCMVDLFGRAGHFDKAISLIEKIPSSDSLLAWFVFMGACKKSGNVKLGKLAFKHAIQVDKSAGACCCVGDLYAAAGVQEDVNKMKANGPVC